MRLEDLVVGDVVSGVVPDSPVTIEEIRWSGPDHVIVIHEDAWGVVGRRVLTRSDEVGLGHILPVNRSPVSVEREPPYG